MSSLSYAMETGDPNMDVPPHLTHMIKYEFPAITKNGLIPEVSKKASDSSARLVAPITNMFRKNIGPIKNKIKSTIPYAKKHTRENIENADKDLLMSAVRRGTGILGTSYFGSLLYSKTKEERLLILENTKKIRALMPVVVAGLAITSIYKKQQDRDNRSSNNALSKNTNRSKD